MHHQQQQQQPAGLLQRGIQILTQATSLDAQQRYHEAVEAYHSGIATLYLAYAEETRGAAVKQMLLNKIAQYQSRADQLATAVVGNPGYPPPQLPAQDPRTGPMVPSTHPVGPSPPPPPALSPHSSTQPPRLATPPPTPTPTHLDIPAHALRTLSTGSPPDANAAGLSQHSFASEEDRALLERINRLRNETTGAKVKATQTAEEIDREYRERVNRLVGRNETTNTPEVQRPFLDVEETTEEEQVEQIMKMALDEARLDITSGPVADQGTDQQTKVKKHHRKKERQQLDDSDTEEDLDSSDAYSSDDGAWVEEEVRKRRARMEKERHLTFGQRWELRKKEREERRKGRAADPLCEREEAFMAKKEKEEREKEEKYLALFLKNYYK